MEGWMALWEVMRSAGQCLGHYGLCSKLGGTFGGWQGLRAPRGPRGTMSGLRGTGATMGSWVAL